MLIILTDDFDIRKIAESGQCFRANPGQDGSFCFVAGDRKCTIRPVSESGEEITMDVDVATDEWESFWKWYFDMETQYSLIRQNAMKFEDEFMIQACNNGKGIRILRQDPWEMLISFIISQRKSIPAIKSCIEKLCAAFGEKKDAFYAFPTPKALANADITILSQCGLGYRLPYIKDAATKVFNGEIDLTAVNALDDESLSDELKTIKGVGDKVANCILLFAYHRTSSVPVDTWVKKIMKENYDGQNPFPKYGEYAGIMQQYAFFHKRTLHEDDE